MLLQKQKGIDFLFTEFNSYAFCDVRLEGIKTLSKPVAFPIQTVSAMIQTIVSAAEML
jgi:hypothetical protein